MKPPPHHLQSILFDLDGVLIDSVPAVGAAMSHALKQMGRAPLTPEQARPLIGPPLEDSAALALGSDDPTLVQTFVSKFRAEYRRTYLDVTVPAPGLGDVVPALARRYVLLVATSKPEAYAVPLLNHFGVASHFRAILGRSLALDHHTKAQVIGRAIAHVPDVPPENLLMVGDRHFDVEGAREHGILTVGICSGTGGARELEEAGAAWLVDGLPELHAWLSGPAAAPPSA